MKSASCAVMPASGSAAASSNGRPAGIARSMRSCTTASSACPSPAEIAMTRSPARHAVTPSPARTTSPASSRPGTSGRVPAGGA